MTEATPGERPYNSATADLAAHIVDYVLTASGHPSSPTSLGNLQLVTGVAAMIENDRAAERRARRRLRDERLKAACSECNDTGTIRLGEDEGQHEDVACLRCDPEPRRRLRECVERWPDAHEGGYDPRCCRFPKSCSADVYDDDAVSEGDLEPRIARAEKGHS